MATLHTSIRAYILDCTYPNGSTHWQDNPAALISAVQTALSGVSNFSYVRLEVGNVKNASGNKLEIEIHGIVYTNKTKLNATENDALISALNTAFGGVANFTYSALNIVNDRFSEDITAGWPGQSFEDESNGG